MIICIYLLFFFSNKFRKREKILICRRQKKSKWVGKVRLDKLSDLSENFLFKILSFIRILIITPKGDRKRNICPILIQNMCQCLAYCKSLSLRGRCEKKVFEVFSITWRKSEFVLKQSLIGKLRNENICVLFLPMVIQIRAIGD